MLSFLDFSTLLDLLHCRPAEDLDPATSQLCLIDPGKSKDLINFLIPLYSNAVRKFSEIPDEVHLVIFNQLDPDLFLYLTTSTARQGGSSPGSSPKAEEAHHDSLRGEEREREMYNYSYDGRDDQEGERRPGLCIFVCRRYYDPENKEHDVKEAKLLSSVINCIVQFIWREIFGK
jgi:hypothetical protein